MDLSVVIPVYNEEANLATLHARLSAVLDGLNKQVEVVLVDDGSRDRSAEILRELAAKDRRIVAVELARNYGQHAAVFAGFEHAKGAVVVTLDADLQNPPEEIPKLLAKIDEGYDVVGGWRAERHDSVFRTLPSKLVNRFTSRVTGCNLKDYGCMLRAYRSTIVERMLKHRELCTFIPALATQVGGRVIEIPVDHAARHAGVSQYNLWGLIRLNYDLVTGFSVAPLQLLSWAGVAFAGAGLLAGLIGWSAFALLSFFSGVQLFGMGLLGEYLGRVYQEVRGRPRYLIGRVTRS